MLLMLMLMMMTQKKPEQRRCRKRNQNHNQDQDQDQSQKKTERNSSQKKPFYCPLAVRGGRAGLTPFAGPAAIACSSSITAPLYECGTFTVSAMVLEPVPMTMPMPMTMPVPMPGPQAVGWRPLDAQSRRRRRFLVPAASPLAKDNTFFFVFSFFSVFFFVCGLAA